MRSWMNVIGLLLAGIVITPAHSQDLLTVDLATGGQTDTATIAPGRYRVRVVYRIPRYRYTVHVSEHTVPIPPLDVGLVGMAPGRCVSLNAALTAFDTVEKEEDVPRLLQDLAKARDEAVAEGGCTSLVVHADSLRERTALVYPDVFNVSKGGFVLAVVTRLPDSGVTGRRWEKVFTTGPRGEWRTSFGYSFPILSGIASGGEFADEARYYVDPVEDAAGAYVIRRQHSRRRADAVPSVFFTFAPADEGGFTWNRLTVGLGADLTNPAVFLGTGITYNSNLHVTGGLSYRREAMLAGQYAEGDTVSTNLTFDQLHEDVFRLRPFVALTLRFTSNPFRRSTGSSGAREARPENSAPGQQTGPPGATAVERGDGLQ